MRVNPTPLTPDERRQISTTITTISSPRPSFYLLVVLSTTIATYGLLANSTAVVIGAMLVAPLMGPIFGIALALCSGNRRLLALAGLAEGIGVVLAIGIGLAMGFVPLRAEFGSEILGRTQPTLYDILIALASGAAGAYTFINPKLNPALTGVAIATALVPPLATCGLCLSAGEWGLASGAFLLFFANFLAIEIVAAVVFTLAGLTTAEDRGREAVRTAFQRFGPSLLLLCGVGVYMTHTLVEIITERRLAGTLKGEISREVSATTGAYLTEIHITHQGNGLEVVADVLTPQAFEPLQVAEVEQAVRKRINRPLHLVIRSLLSKDADRNGPVFLSQSQLQEQAQAATQAALLQRISQLLQQRLQIVPGARLVDVRRDNPEEGAPLTVTAVVRTPTAIHPDQVSTLEQPLTHLLDQPVRLVVRSILTRDADANRFLYEESDESPPLGTTDAQFRARLEAAVSRELGKAVPGASLVELQYEKQGDHLNLLAIARTPRNFEPDQVARVQSALRKALKTKIELVVRSVVGTDTTPDGYRRTPGE